MRWLRDRFRLREERGQTIIFVSAALPVLLAAGALVVDGSQLFVNKRSLQNAADAAALAAARDLSTTACGARRVGTQRGSTPVTTTPIDGGAPLPACASGFCDQLRPEPVQRQPDEGRGAAETRRPNAVRAHLRPWPGREGARRRGDLARRAPAAFSFGSLNRGGAGCDHHTLVVRVQWDPDGQQQHLRQLVQRRARRR